MISGLWNGIAGVVTHERALDNEANNVANVTTVGHKGNEVRFQDLVYQKGFGNGSNIERISKKFTQGNIKSTNNSYDLAIQGDGFFILKDDKYNKTFYSRAGNFRKGEDGTLVTANGFKVLGSTPKNNEIVSTDPKIKFLTKEFNKFIVSTSIKNKDFLQTINSSTTDYVKTAKDVNESGKGFKTKYSVLKDVEALLADYRAKLELYEGNSSSTYKKSTRQIKVFEFTKVLTELNDKNDKLKITINNKEIIQLFDTDIKTTMNKFADKISQEVGIKATIDKDFKLRIESLIPGKVDFITYVSLNSDNALETDIEVPSLGKGKGLVDSSRDALKKAIELAGGKFFEITNTIVYNKETELKVNQIQLSPDKLGLFNNKAGDVEIDNGGGIYIRDGKNKYLIGKVETAYFRDDQGLQALGNNLFTVSKLSGEARNAIKKNTLVGSSLEQSNISTADSMVNILAFQKAFEANSKSITTSDELLKIAINLRK